jgi:hypothetical protein
MSKFFVLLSLFANALAFIPVGKVSKTSALQMGYEKEIGAQAPLGFFDPLSLLKDADQETFDRYRYAELKHGRIAMLAVLGHIVTTKGDRFPGEIAYGVPFSSIKNGLAAFTTIPSAGVLQLFFFIGLLELGFSTVQKDIEAFCTNEAKKAGWSEATLKNKQAIELNNGRAAQMGILTLVVHELLNNDPYIINSLLGAPVKFN